MGFAHRFLLVVPGDQDGSRFLVWMVAPAVLTSLLMAGDSLRLLSRVDLVAPNRVTHRKRVVLAGFPARNSLPRLSFGGGLRSTAWDLYRGKLRQLRFPWIQGPVRALWDCRALAYGFLGVMLLASSQAEAGSLGAFYFGAIILGAGLFLPSPLELPASRRLHLLGADLPEVARHNRRGGFYLAVVPVFLGGILVLQIPSLVGRLGAPGIWSALLACTGSTLMAKAGAMRGISEAMDRAGWVVVTLVGVVALSGWLVSPRLALTVIGPALFVAALAAFLLDLTAPRDDARELMEKAADD